MALEEKDPPLVTVTQTAPGDGAGGPTPAPDADIAQLKERDSKRYQFIAEHGRGGLGRVMRTRDKDLGREVAIKEILNPGGLSEARFVREAMITARLEHPGIVPVHDAGRWPDGTPFYSMKLVSGRPLKELLQGANTVEARLALVPHVVAVAEAIAYAHDRGIIHRDLKPSNIIVGDFGETVVIDWGLAKDVREQEKAPSDFGVYRVSEDAALTQAGAVVGTPAYMPPEQASGGEVDARSDVYALGAILYHVLAASPPFLGSTSAEILANVLHGPPRDILQIQANSPADLCAIVRKAMARDPADRYVDARTIAEDLRRFQTGQIVSAHRYSVKEVLGRWCRRNKVPLVIVGLAVLSLLLTGVLSVSRIIAATNVAEKRQREAEMARGAEKGLRAEADERANSLIVTQAREQLSRDPTQSIAWLLSYPSPPYPSDVSFIVADAISRGISSQVFRGFNGVLWTVQFSRDAKLVIASAANDDVRVLNVESGTLLQSFSTKIDRPFLSAQVGTGKMFFVESENSVAEIDPSTGVIGHLKPCRPPIFVVTPSPDGRWLACASVSGEVTVVDLEAGTVARPHLGGNATNIEFSKDSKTLVVGMADGRVSVYSGGRVRPLVRNSVGGQAWAVLPLDDAAATVVLTYSDGSAYLSKNGRLRRIADPAAFPIVAVAQDRPVVALATPSGRLSVWDGDGSNGERVLGMAAGGAYSITVSPDAKFVAVGSKTGSVDIWDLTTGQHNVLLGHSKAVTTLAFSPDSSLLASGSEDRTVRVWPTNRPSPRRLGTAGEVLTQLQTATDGTYVTASNSGTTRLWRSSSTHETSVTDHKGVVFVAVSPDGSHVGTTGWDGLVTLWDTTTAHSEVVDHLPSQGWDVTFSVSGDTLAAAGSDGTIALIDVKTRRVRRLQEHGGQVRRLLFSVTNDQVLYSASFDRTIRRWDLSTGASRVFRGHSDVVYALASNAEGTLLASGGWEGAVRLWNASDGKSFELGRHAGRVRSLAFVPFQPLLATGADDGRVCLWNTILRTSRCSAEHSDMVTQVAVSPDGRLVASASLDGTARIWNIADGSAAVLRAHSGAVTAIAFLEDGKSLATTGTDGFVHQWLVSDVPFAAADWMALRASITEVTSVRLRR